MKVITNFEKCGCQSTTIMPDITSDSGDSDAVPNEIAHQQKG